MDDRATVSAKRFFRREAKARWGYLIRKRKEQTPREKTIASAQKVYWEGMRRAWEIYTKDNEIVKQAKETLDKAIHQACELHDETSSTTEEFFKAVQRMHDNYAETVESIWKAFVKDMKKSF